MPTFTASEIIALVAIIVGPVIGYLTGSRLQSSRDAADREKARTDRKQARRADVYVDVLEHLYRSQDYVNRTEPIMTMTGDPPPPEWPTQDAMRKLNARVAAFGSPEMLTRLEASTRLAMEFQVAVFMLRSYRDGQGMDGSDKTMEAWQDVEAKRKTYNDAVKALRELANRELAE